MFKFYWIFAGAFIGVFSVFMSFINLSILAPNGVNGGLSLAGQAIVIVEYTLLVYLLSLGQKYFEKKK